MKKGENHLNKLALIGMLLLVPCLFLNAQSSINLDSLVRLTIRLADDSSKVNSLNKISSQYCEFNVDSGIYYANKAIKSADKCSYKKGIADAYMNLGKAAVNVGNYDEALRKMNDAAKLYAKILSSKTVNGKAKVLQKQALAYSNMGLIYYFQGNYFQSLEYHYLALAIRQKIKDKEGIADSYNNIGVTNDYQGKYPLALKHHFMALKIREEIGDKQGIADSYNCIGAIYEVQNNFSEALKYHFLSLKIAKANNDEYGMGNSYNNIGNIFEKQAKYDEAIEYRYKSLKMRLAINDKRGISDCYNNIGNDYYFKGKFEDALKNHLAALKVREEAGMKESVAMSYNNIGNVYVSLKQYKKAYSFYTQAIKISNEIGSLDDLKESYLHLSELEQEDGKFEKALIHYKMNILIRDSLVNKENTKKSVETQMQYEFDKKESLAKAAQDKKDAIVKEEKRRQNLFLLLIAVIALALGAIAFIVFRSLKITRKQKSIIELQKEEVEKQKDLIVHQKEIVEEKNHEILQSITYAQRLQDAILPPLRIVKAYLKESFILYKPKDIVAGDFYWMETVQFENLKMKQFENEEIDHNSNNEIVLFAAADCTGHGVPGAMVSVVCSNALNRTVKEFGITSPGLILDKVRELVIETFVKSESEIKDGMDISLCAFNTSTGTLQWAGANNPLWIIRSETKELEIIKPDKQPIGKTENPLPFTTHTINLDEGDCFYIFTDGYQDQFGGDKGKKFMAAKMKEMFLSIYSQSMEEQKKSINENIENWKGDLEQVDDICVIGVRV